MAVNGKFFCVWNEKRDVPMARHPHKEAAMREAERLSVKRPGNIFFVLESVGLKFVPEKVSR